MKFTHFFDGYGQTTDGSTPVVIGTLDMTTAGPGGTAINDCLIFLEATLLGSDIADGYSGAYVIQTLFQYYSGTLTKVGNETTIYTWQGNFIGSGYAQMAVNNDTIEINMTGPGTYNVDWYLRAEAIIYQP
jgi:hypothetical protein